MPDFAGTRRHDVPPAAELAELVRGGSTLAEVGAPYGLKARAVQNRLNDAGWMRTGERQTFKLAPRPNVATVPEQGEWVARRACDTANADLFFPDGWGKAQQEQAAKLICAGCNVRTECLEWGMEADKVTHKDDRGILGGLTGSERDKVRRKLNKAGD